MDAAARAVRSRPVDFRLVAQLPQLRTSAALDGFSAIHSDHAWGQLRARAGHFMERVTRELLPGKVGRAVVVGSWRGAMGNRALPPVSRRRIAAGIVSRAVAAD